MPTTAKILVGLLLALLFAITGISGAKLYKAAFSEAARTGLEVYYQVPDFSLTDSRGQTFTFEDLKGKVWVADFFFTSCPGPCPIMTAQMARLAEAFKDNPEVHFVGFSVDPETDTPERLTAYAERYDMDPDRWHLLTGPIEKIQALSERGFKLGTVDTPSQHSTRFSLVDQKGRTRAYVDGTNSNEVDSLRGAIARLL